MKPNKRKTYIRLCTCGVIIAAVAAGTALFWTAQKVQMTESRLHRLQEDTANEKQSLHVLHAEWDYLNRPDRLEALAHDRLNMGPPQPGEVVTSTSNLPTAPPASPVQAATVTQPAPVHIIRTPPKVPATPAPVTAPSTPTANRSFQNMLDDLNQNKSDTGSPP